MTATDQEGWRNQVIDEILALRVVYEGLGIGLEIPPRMTAILPVSGGLRIEWIGNLAYSNVVEFIPGLGVPPGSAWTAVWTNPPAPGLTNGSMDTGTADPAGWYRVRSDSP